jgi:predicted HAD superfamily hydrolase
MFQLVHDEINSFKNIQKNEVIHIGDNQTADYNGAISFDLISYLLNKSKKAKKLHKIIEEIGTSFPAGEYSWLNLGINITPKIAELNYSMDL